MANPNWNISLIGEGLGETYVVRSSHYHMQFTLSNNIFEAEALCALLNMLSGEHKRFEIKDI